MRCKHAALAVSGAFDDPNPMSVAGLAPVMRLAHTAGPAVLSQGRLTVPGDKGANAGANVVSRMAGMLAGTDCIDDMNLPRHGGMPSPFHRVYAPLTPGSFLRQFTFGHARQLGAIMRPTVAPNRRSRCSLDCAPTRRAMPSKSI